MALQSLHDQNIHHTIVRYFHVLETGYCDTLLAHHFEALTCIAGLDELQAQI